MTRTHHRAEITSKFALRTLAVDNEKSSGAFALNAT
jgi:hypothetical protein